MSEKNKNGIIEEQRRAREEFLKLKRMQSGEIKADPKPSEVAILPKTPKEKIANFWFQYKVHTISIILITVILAVLITQCATRPKYDLKMVYFSYTVPLSQQTDKIAEYFEKFASDTNNDGEVKVQVVDCSYSETGSTNIQYRNTMLSKLQSILVAEDETLLYITDEKSFEYLNGISEAEIFNGEPLMLSEKFYDFTAVEGLLPLPEGLRISCRVISGTVLEESENSAKAYENAMVLLEKLKKE